MDNHELSEIVKLAGGPRFDPYAKQRKEAEKIRRSNDVGSSPFVIERASAEQQTTATPQQPLYGDFWRTGELAVLIGESGVGKSLLATQIAEVIARGSQDSINGLPTASEPRHVIYFDFARTPEQFSRIYSCQPFDDPDYRQEYNFSNRFDLARLDIINHVPDGFAGNVERYIRFWVCDAIADGNADVVIIDSIEHLAIGTTYEKLMRSLRTAASASGASLLIVARSKPKRRPSAITLADVAHRRAVIDEADSVFTISRSITHPDIRYVKDLKARTTQLTANLPAHLSSHVSDSRSPSEPGAIATGFPSEPGAIATGFPSEPGAIATGFPSEPGAIATGFPSEPGAIATGFRDPNGHIPSAVLTYKIERLPSPIASTDRLPTVHCSPFTVHSGPFLGLRYLALSLESQHLPVRNSAIRTPHSAVRKPGSRAAVAEMLMSKEYRRYLNE